MSDEEQMDSPLGDEMETDSEVEMEEEEVIDTKDMTPEQLSVVSEF